MAVAWACRFLKPCPEWHVSHNRKPFKTMKTTITLSLLLVASLVPVTTQASDRALKGALIGGVAGAIIGSASGERNDVITGAAFGATAGALIGASSDNRGHRGYGSHVSVSYGVGYGYSPRYYGRPYRHYGYGWGYPSIYYSYSRPVYYSPSYEYAQPVQVVSAPEAQPATTQSAQSSPQNVTIINNYYGGSSNMGSANGMFGR
jgi:uncharacterized membrane protein